MKKLLGILVLGLLWCNNSFANSYTCTDEHDETASFVKSGNGYKVVIGDLSWPWEIYEETKELLILGKISHAEDMYKPEIEDGLGMLLFSKIYNTGEVKFFDHKGDNIYSMKLNCRIK